MKLLIVDDNVGVRTTLKLLLAPELGEVAAVGDPTLIPAIIHGGNVDVVLLDMNFDNTKLDCSDGLFWLERIKHMDNAPAVVVITAFGDVEIAVQAMKLGAEDFITKPWDNSILAEKLKRAVEQNRHHKKEESDAKKLRVMEEAQKETEHLSLDEVKMRHIKNVIERCGGNMSAAAEQLKINRQTLYNLLKKL